jgi:transposase InsO family protein
MHKSFKFYLDFLHFGVPEMITSDHGLQFTSSLWFQLCEMLNISHKQTTAYHPELNSKVERLHCRLKDTFAHAPQWQHGPRRYALYSSDSERSRGKTLVFPRLRQFFRCPNCLAKLIFAKR